MGAVYEATNKRHSLSPILRELTGS